VNVTDVATGVVYQTGQRRALAAAGSLGVSFTIAANLGKGATAAGIAEKQAALTSNFGKSSAAMSAITSSVASSAGIPLAKLVPQAPNPEQLAVAGPGAALVPTVIVAGTGGSASTADVAVTGVVVAVVLAIAFFTFWVCRSYKLYGRAPWQVDVRREQYELKNKALQEAEERFNEDSVPMTLNPVVNDALTAPAAKSQALTLRVPKAAAKEIEALRAKEQGHRAELEAARAEAARISEELAALRAAAAAKGQATSSFAPVAVGGVREFSALPPGWTETTDPSSGRVYYFNAVTKATSWTKPEKRG
jgi:hypothetical protein